MTVLYRILLHQVAAAGHVKSVLHPLYQSL